MTQLAKRIELPPIRIGSYNAAVDALTFGSKYSSSDQRQDAISFFGRICERVDAVMVLGNALADFGDKLKDEERIEIARALSRAPAKTLSRELAISFLNRASKQEPSASVKMELLSALADLAD